MKSGAELITEERARHVTKECYDAQHDDQHVHGEMAGAAACYTLWHCSYIGKFCWRLAMAMWPWSEECWKPKDPVRDLVRAGSLIAAEIDRIQRLQEEKPRLIVS